MTTPTSQTEPLYVFAVCMLGSRDAAPFTGSSAPRQRESGARRPLPVRAGRRSLAERNRHTVQHQLTAGRVRFE